MLVAGMREDGTVEVLGFCISTTEQCRELLEDLRRRGLEDVELFLSDDSIAIRSALETTLAAGRSLSGGAFFGWAQRWFEVL